MNDKYKEAGVDIEAGYKAVELIKGLAGATYRKEVLSDLGGFGGLFSIAKAKDMDDPVLVSGTDSAGTKVKVAFIMNKHDTIGIDCVAMCVNDIICCGAEPLFFLDYIACGKNDPEKIADIVKGVADGCKMANVSLIGGETAEMPGVYQPLEYDVAGFAVGIVDKKNIIDGKSIKPGDAVIGLASSGLHSNGYSLVRKAFRLAENNINEEIDSLGKSLGEELIMPTKIYVESILELIKAVNVKGISNITGGGFYENIPRCFGKNLKAVINANAWQHPPIFDLISKAGNISDEEMFGTFNMGIGMILVVENEDAERTVAELEKLGETAYVIGHIDAKADGETCGVQIC